jgi:CPA2 family monovalent cation:H+ antiporter-2
MASDILAHTVQAAPVVGHAAAISGQYAVGIVFLTAAAVFVPLFNRFRISPVLGFLMVGVILGPDGLGRLADMWPVLAKFTVTQSEDVHNLAELGVVFLLFAIGLELTWERLKAMRRMVFGLGMLQIILCTLVLFGLFLMMKRPPESAIALAMALALSSTAMVMPVLAELKKLNTATGRSVFSVLLAQDLAVAPILITVIVLAGGEGGPTGVQGVLAIIPSIVVMALLVLGGRMLLRPLFKSAALTKSPEIFMAACLLVVLMSGQAAVMAGLSMAMGAFVGGLLLAETEYRREIELMIEPFKGLLLGLFFVTVGARLDIDAVMASPVLVLALAGGLIALKAVVVYPLARLYGLPRAAALEVAALLGPAGEFAFVIIDEGMGRNLIDPQIGQAIILAAIISLFLLPVIGSTVTRFTKRISPQKEAEPSAAPDIITEVPNDVLVVGYGRVGELVVDMLGRHNISFTIVDVNPRVTSRARSQHLETWYGDASNVEFLARLGLEHRKAVVVTVSNAAFTDNVVKAVRSLRDDICLIARARDAHHAERLYELGVTDAVPETIEASLQLAENTLVDLGVPMGLVLASIHDKRDEFRARLAAHAPEGRASRVLRSTKREPKPTEKVV